MEYQRKTSFTNWLRLASELVCPKADWINSLSELEQAWELLCSGTTETYELHLMLAYEGGSNTHMLRLGQRQWPQRGGDQRRAFSGGMPKQYKTQPKELLRAQTEANGKTKLKKVVFSFHSEHKINIHGPTMIHIIHTTTHIKIFFFTPQIQTFSQCL